MASRKPSSSGTGQTRQIRPASEPLWNLAVTHTQMSVHTHTLSHTQTVCMFLPEFTTLVKVMFIVLPVALSCIHEMMRYDMNSMAV